MRRVPVVLATRWIKTRWWVEDAQLFIDSFLYDLWRQWRAQRLLARVAVLPLFMLPLISPIQAFTENDPVGYLMAGILAYLVWSTWSRARGSDRGGPDGHRNTVLP